MTTTTKTGIQNGAVTYHQEKSVNGNPETRIMNKQKKIAIATLENLSATRMLRLL